MNLTDLLSSIDSEIARLQEARALLAVQDRHSATPTKKKRSVMSAEGRARIAAAQKARWAKLKAAKKG